MSGQKLYLHKTDGGAEYLCTGENDIGTAVVRLDGGPVLVGNGCMLANAANTLEALRALLVALRREQKSNGLREELVTTSSAVTNARAAIARATGTSA